MTWSEGFRAGLNGATYDDNPHQEPAATAWAFGCSEGMKERNRLAFRSIIAGIAKHEGGDNAHS